ncbi:MAG: site-specific integrase [Acidobacteria bacterium]|nr:MAG: site-specific integrase [Acidobacteriota bacterium]
MTRRTRGKGEGSVYQRGDGYWAAAIEAGRDPRTGARRRRTVVRRTKAEVLAALNETRANIAAGVEDDTRTVHAWLDEWLETVAPTRVKESSLVTYRQVVSKRVKPHLPDVRLTKLTPSHVRRMLADLAAAGYSPSSQRQARAVLGRALRVAQGDGLVGRNVAQIVDGPTGVRPKTDDTLTAGEARDVLDAARSDRLYPAALLVLRLGLRKGELLALRWADVDLTAETLTVSGTLQTVRGGGWEITEPKTAGSARTLPLVAGLAEALTAHRARQAEERLAAGTAWHDYGFVFTTSIGTPIEGRNLLRWWKDLLVAAGVTPRRIHAARHTAATLLIEEHAPLEVVAAVLGHASIRTTSDVYVRVRGDVMRQSLTRLAAAYDQ